MIYNLVAGPGAPKAKPGRCQKILNCTASAMKAAIHAVRKEGFSVRRAANERLRPH